MTRDRIRKVWVGEGRGKGGEERGGGANLIPMSNPPLTYMLQTKGTISENKHNLGTFSKITPRHSLKAIIRNHEKNERLQNFL